MATNKGTLPTSAVALFGDDYLDGVNHRGRLKVENFTTPGTMTFSFPASASNYNGQPEAVFNFAVATTTVQDAVRKTLNGDRGFSTIIPVAYSETTESDTVHADLRFASTGFVSTAQGHLPVSSADVTMGDVWFGGRSPQTTGLSANFEAAVPGEYGGVSYWHETGHTHGLKHTHVAYTTEGYGGASAPIQPTGLGPSDGSDPTDKQYQGSSVMSYRVALGGGVTWPTGGNNLAQSLMMYDIAVLQGMYGAYSTTATKTYTYNATTGECSINGVGQGAALSPAIYETIYSGESNVILDVSNFSSTQTIDIRPGKWSIINSSMQVGVFGNIAMSLHTTNLLKQVKTGSGTNTVRVNNAANILTGGGADTAIFGGNLADYGHVKNGTGDFTLTDNVGSESTTRLINFDFAQFADQTVACSTFDTSSGVGYHSRGLFRLHA